jgi:hypothetical protein
LAGFGLEDSDERAEGHVIAIFGPLFAGEQSLIATRGQVIHAGLQFGICFQGEQPPSRLRGQAFAKGANESVESWSSIHPFHEEIIPLRWQGAKEGCETETHSTYRTSTGGAIWRLSRRLQASGQALPDAIALARSVCRCRSHDAKSYVEIMKIGFVSLLSDSRFLYATLFHVMTSILGTLALFGHFFLTLPDCRY